MMNGENIILLVTINFIFHLQGHAHHIVLLHGGFPAFLGLLLVQPSLGGSASSAHILGLSYPKNGSKICVCWKGKNLHLMR